MRERKRLMLESLLIATLIVSIPTVATALLVKQHVIAQKGKIVIVTPPPPPPPPPPPELELNVYSDESCSVVLTEIDWGSLEPGESKSFPAYVKNLGDVPFNMSLSTQNWDPAEAETYMTLSWDYANQTVQVGEVLP